MRNQSAKCTLLHPCGKWPAQVGTLVANVGMVLSLLRMAINMANRDYLSFFSMEWTGTPLPTAGSGVPGVNYNISLDGILFNLVGNPSRW